MTDWSRIARETIDEVHRALPEAATRAEREVALRNAYPFGEREMWPYKAWLNARRAYLDRVCGPNPAKSARVLLAGRDDITFPFADSDA